MRAHNLIWPATEHNKPWVLDMTNPSDLKNFMETYITNTVKAIGNVYCWDVVNELFGFSGKPEKFEHYPYVDSPFYEIGAPDTKSSWVCDAFKTAKSANPNVKMFYNDDMISSMVGTDARKGGFTYTLAKYLVDNNCGIDGIGFESHVDINFADENFPSIKENIRRYAAIGLEVMFTETDVRCNRKYNSKCAWGDGAWP